MVPPTGCSKDRGSATIYELPSLPLFVRSVNSLASIAHLSISHFFPISQGGHSRPPQSTSVSPSFLSFLVFVQCSAVGEDVVGAAVGGDVVGVVAGADVVVDPAGCAVGNVVGD